VGDIFLHLLGNKMAHADERKCSSEWSTKHSGGACYKGRGCCYGLCTVAFSNGVYKPMDFDIDVDKDNEIFSPHRREKAYISAN